MMNRTSIVQYKPLMEVVDFHGNKYYSEKSKEEIEDLMDGLERIFFPFNNRGVRVAQIVDYGLADPEDVMIAWMVQNLTKTQRNLFEASKKLYIECWHGTKPITEKKVRDFIELAKK